jgi:hypothetical protein
MSVVEVHGEGLGALFAVSLLARRGVNVTWTVQSSHVDDPRVWHEAEIDGLRFDAGFHAIDTLRAPALVLHLLNDMKLDLFTWKADDGLWIEGNALPMRPPLESMSISMREWAGFEVGDVQGNPSFLIASTSLTFQHLLGSIGTRYSDEEGRSDHLLSPWFLPSNYSLLSLDEGDVIRELQAQGVVPNLRTRPEGTFQAMARIWIRMLTDAWGVKISPVEGKQQVTNPRAVSKSPRRQHLWLFRADEQLNWPYDLMLVADSLLPFVARVFPGNPVSTASGEDVLVEVFDSEEHPVDRYEYVSATEDFLKRYFGSESPIRFVGAQTIRKFVPSTEGAASAASRPTVSIRSNGRGVELRYASHGPANMAKVSTVVTSAVEEVLRELPG